MTDLNMAVTVAEFPVSRIPVVNVATIPHSGAGKRQCFWTLLTRLAAGKKRVLDSMHILIWTMQSYLLYSPSIGRAS